MKDHEEDVQIESEDQAKRGFAASPDDADEASFREAEHKVRKLKHELEHCAKEKQEYLDGWQRAKADYVNALKRFDEDRKREHQKGVVKAAEALLPAFDAMERAKEHLSRQSGAKAGSELPEGFAGILKQLEGGFASLGLEPLGAEGEAFDPAMHDAMGQEPTDDKEKDDTVSAVLEKGWKIAEHVIRPAKVRVYHFAS